METVFWPAVMTLAFLVVIWLVLGWGVYLAYRDKPAGTTMNPVWEGFVLVGALVSLAMAFVLINILVCESWGMCLPPEWMATAVAGFFVLVVLVGWTRI